MHQAPLFARACGAPSALLAILMAACVTGDVTDVSAPIPPPDTTGGGTTTIQRGSITAVVSIDPSDAATAQAVGLGVGGLTVTLTPLGGGGGEKTADTDASGRVQFTGLLEGQYGVGITRALTAEERSRLPANAQDATVFAGGASTRLFAGQNTTLPFPLVANKRGSLVISELFSYNAAPNNYGMGDYVEIYNNGDTTEYLDGMLLAASGVNGYHTPSRTYCDSPESTRFRLDNTRFWALVIWRFPGSAGGRTLAVQPGAGWVVAMDALNHTAASGQAEYPDLSRAQFEQYMSDADTDNPGAINMERAWVPGTGIFGRGYPNSSNRSFALALPVDSSAWTRDWSRWEFTPVPGQALDSSLYTGLPAEAVLDVFSYAGDPVRAASFGLPTPCDPWIGPALDGGVAAWHSYNTPQAMRRKSLGFDANGRETLQRTRNSSRDLEYGPQLQRSLNRR